MESVKRLLWWILAGSSGGPNRARIIDLLDMRPFNANKIAQELGLDYKTVRHHIRVLEENGLVISRGQGYGKMYFLSPLLEREMASFREIWEEIGKTLIRQAVDRKSGGDPLEASKDGKATVEDLDKKAPATDGDSRTPDSGEED